MSNNGPKTRPTKPKRPKPIITPSMVTVSYTHLDVYKRQEEVKVMSDKAMKVYGVSNSTVELSELKVSKDNIDEDVMKHLN